MVREKATPKPKKAAATASSRAVSGLDLPALRERIDQVGREIVGAINEWVRLVSEARRLAGDPSDPIGELDTERREIARVLDLNQGPLPDASVRAVFHELIGGSHAVGSALRVAFLGPEYSYSHLAAICRFGQSVDLVPVTTIAAVFEEVLDGRAEYGIVPMENSTDGRVGDTLEMFARSPARICGELPLRIHHNLLGRGLGNEVTQVFSKPQALSQCRHWLAKHLPGTRGIEVASTSEAARRAQKSTSAAAIASLQAAARYELRVLARNIEDNQDNQTRFAVIGGAPAERTGDDKTALLFEVDHRPGALADAMAIFKRNRLNMTWIESYPIRGMTGRYLFFVEFVGHQQDLRARRAIATLQKRAIRAEVLGSYARMDPIG